MQTSLATFCVATLLVNAASAENPPTSGKQAAPFAVRVVGSGPPIIFIPGLTCSGDVWNSTVEHFKKTHECHVLTLAGFAEQPAVEGPFMERNVKAIGDYIRQKKLDHPVIVGHSIGGFLTYLIGIAEGDNVGPLVSVDGVPFLAGMMNPDLTAEQAKKNGEMMSAQMQAQTREEYLQRQQMILNSWIDDLKNRQKAQKWGADSDQKTVAIAMGEMFGRDMRTDVSKIKQRVMLIAAPAPFPGKTKEELKLAYLAQVDKIPNKEVVYAEKSKHFIMFDEPEWMCQQIERFIQGKPVPQLH
jgi:pimeloyl-ACP methyl ester carboxylesterase